MINQFNQQKTQTFPVWQVSCLILGMRLHVFILLLFLRFEPENVLNIHLRSLKVVIGILTSTTKRNFDYKSTFIMQ